MDTKPITIKTTKGPVTVEHFWELLFISGDGAGGGKFTIGEDEHHISQTAEVERLLRWYRLEEKRFGCRG